MYLLKSDLPPTVLVFLNELNLRSQSPAWLMITDSGVLSKWGGSLAYYGISNLQSDRSAAEQLRFLAGMLPVETEAVELPCVETDSGIYADIHIWAAFGWTWVLLVDTTTHALEYRRMQQRGNELSLLNLRQEKQLTHEFINELFSGLEVMALEITAEHDLHPASRFPDWFVQLFPQSVTQLNRATLSERFPFLANFLIDAEAFWQEQRSGKLDSGHWIETDESGAECQLEASAISVHQTRLLLLQNTRQVDDEMQSILQKARENILNYQRLARAESALRRSEARNRALLEAIPDLILRMTLTGDILDYNARDDREWIIPPEQFLGKNVTEFLSPAQESLARQHLAEYQQTGSMQAFEYQLQRNGQPAFFEIRFADCGDNELLTIIRDVTERRQAQEAEMLKRSEEYFRSLIENSSDIIVVVNADSTIRYESPSMERILGYTPAERIGKSAFEYIHPDDLPAVLEQQKQLPAMSPDQLVTQELRLRHRDGSWRWIEAVGRNLLTHPQINGLVLTFHDITERKKAEAEQMRLQETVRRNETMAAMGSLVAGVAHEVRNPLFSLSATLDAFEARFQDQPSHQQYIRVLRGEIERLNRLMQDLLQYGKPQQLNLQSVALSEVIEHAIQSVRELADQSGVTIAADLPGQYTVQADSQRLKQVFRNLIENAIQHAPAGSKVTVKTTAVESGTEVICHIRDQGPGFPPEHRLKVFEPFFSLRRGGTGLGLSIVQRIVEEHGGEVTADNHAEGGAEIMVKLPLAH